MSNTIKQWSSWPDALKHIEKLEVEMAQVKEQLGAAEEALKNVCPMACDYTSGCSCRRCQYFAQKEKK